MEYSVAAAVWAAAEMEVVPREVGGWAVVPAEVTEVVARAEVLAVARVMVEKAVVWAEVTEVVRVAAMGVA